MILIMYQYAIKIKCLLSGFLAYNTNKHYNQQPQGSMCVYGVIYQLFKLNRHWGN